MSTITLRSHKGPRSDRLAAVTTNMQHSFHTIVYQLSKYLAFRDKRKVRATSKTACNNIAWTSEDLNAWLCDAIQRVQKQDIRFCLPFVKSLLQDKRVNPGTDVNFAIRWASFHGHVGVVRRAERTR